MSQSAITLATRMTAKHGTSLNLIRLDSSAALDKPWLGIGQQTVEIRYPVVGVFVPTAGADLGFEIKDKSVTTVAIVAGDGNNYENVDLIEADNNSWTIKFIEKLQTADVTILWYFGVER